MDDETNSSEHLRLELDMLEGAVEPAEAQAESLDSEPSYRVLVESGDPNMRSYLEDCIRRIPRVILLAPSSRVRPDLIVFDSLGGRSHEALPAGVPRVVVAGERPPAAEATEKSSRQAPVAFIVTPFDARVLILEALRLLSSA